MKQVLIAMFVLALGAQAQESAKEAPKPKAEAKPPEPKKIPDALITAYFKARAENAEAQLNAANKVAALQASAEALQKFCPVMLDPTGTPACTPEPEKPKVPAK